MFLLFCVMGKWSLTLNWTLWKNKIHKNTLLQINDKHSNKMKCMQSELMICYWNINSDAC